MQALTLILGLGCVDYGVTRATERQSWTQPSRAGGVDVLWVVDDSLSMYEEQEQLSAHGQAFIDLLLNVPVDFELGLTTTDMAVRGGELMGPLLSAETPELGAEFTRQLDLIGEGSRDERGFDAAVVASAALTRQGADLEVVFFSDEDDQSELGADSFLAQLRDLVDGQVAVSAVTGPLPQGCASLVAAADPAPSYLQAAEASDGLRESICSSDYEALMERIALQVLGMDKEFALTAVPERGSIEVRVDGVLIPERERHGWAWDPGQNLIQLDGFAVPRPGSTLVVEYYERLGFGDTGGLEP